MDKPQPSADSFGNSDPIQLAVPLRDPELAAREEAAAETAAPAKYIEAGTREFWRVNIALMTAAFCTFALIYCVQPLMPLLASVFHVSPAQSSLSLSVTTGLLAVGMLFSGLASEMLHRKALMATSLLISASLTVATAFAPNWHLLLATRVLTGLAICGVPAVAMAYVGEEIDPRSGGLAMGLYIAGNAFGGMSGRLLTGLLTDLLNWRWAIGIIGGLGLFGSALFLLLLPPSRHFKPRSPDLAELKLSLLGHFQDPGLPLLFSMGFLLMGTFVSIYNYLGFRLMAPPYNFSQTTVGLLFTIYAVGMFSSAWAGDLAVRRGRRLVLMAMVLLMAVGVASTLASPSWAILAGLTAMTFGFYAAHAVVSAWVGFRAKRAKAVASSFYLFSYYMGSGIVGTYSGTFWSAYGWPGVVGAVSVLLLAALIVVFFLRDLPPAQTAGSTT
ncbi:MAG: MFS transporter [Candidatus Korobacteraceae bacterium]|jgi:YNFM family putative membrane transporter